MRILYGYVLTYSVQTGEGTISGDDGGRYNFTNRDWIGDEVPERSSRVEFTTTADGRAANVYLIQPVRQASGQSPVPQIAAGCGAGCVSYFILGFILTLVSEVGFSRFLGNGSDSNNFPTLLPSFLALIAGVVIGYSVYRGVRARRWREPFSWW